MTFHLRVAGCALLTMLLSGAAYAKASASINLVGGQTLTIGPTSGAGGIEGGGSTVLAPGQSWTFTVPYSATLMADGLDATRDWQFCTPSMPDYCGAAPTGHELAEAVLFWDLDSRSGRFDDLTVSASSDLDFSVSSGSHTYSGTMTFTATNVGFEYREVDAVLMAAGFVDANPIPEPQSWALMASGLLLVGGLSALRRT